jgi:hypothetical protein
VTENAFQLIVDCCKTSGRVVREWLPAMLTTITRSRQSFRSVEEARLYLFIPCQPLANEHTSIWDRLQTSALRSSARVGMKMSGPTEEHEEWRSKKGYAYFQQCYMPYLPIRSYPVPQRVETWSRVALSGPAYLHHLKIAKIPVRV